MTALAACSSALRLSRVIPDVPSGPDAASASRSALRDCEGGGLVDAPGRGLVGAKGEYPHCPPLSAPVYLPVETATTLRIHDGMPLTTDGPFVETKKQIWGFILIDARALTEDIQ